MSTDIALVINENPIAVLTDAQTYSSFYAHMKAEVDAHVPDLTTAKGRAEIASLAFKVAKTKTTIDAAGKLLNEEARAKINVVDEARRKIRDELDALRDLARKPLTDWEAAEEARAKRGQDLLAHIQAIGNGIIGNDPQSFAVLFYELDETVPELITEDLGEYEQMARDAARTARERLGVAFAAEQRAAADRAELDRLRAAEDDRLEKEREAQVRRDEEEAMVRAEKERQEAVARAAEIEREKIAAATKAAEDAAREAAEKKAEEARQAVALAHTEALAAEKKRADDANAAREKEVRENAAREAEFKRLADEQAAREKDRAHRGKVMGEAKAYLIELGVDESLAKTIVLAIVANSVPHVSLRF